MTFKYTLPMNGNTTNGNSVDNIIMEKTKGGFVIVVEKGFEFEGYGFALVREMHDDVPAGVLEEDVVYTGDDNIGFEYCDGSQAPNLPKYVKDYVEQKGYNIIVGSDAGYKNWNGRPEFSETYFRM